MTGVVEIKFRSFAESVPEAMDAAGAAKLLPRKGLVILKPNLTNDSPPPVTTPAECVEAVWRYCAAHSGAEIAIGEGCGSGRTADTFRANGYTEFARRERLRLIDFNEEPDVRLERADALQLKELWLPKVALDAFIISIPVLKDHSFTVTTIAMKNMFGLCPAPRYRGNWNKSGLHSPSTHRSVVDVCLYKPPGFCVVDASVALAGMHLAGTPRKLGRILAGSDPVAVDAAASRLLGHEAREIEYLCLADGRLGSLGGS
jgi:uncharacterized protein (DUF362 family)